MPLSTTTMHFLNTSRESDSITSLRSLFQWWLKVSHRFLKTYRKEKMKGCFSSSFPSKALLLGSQVAIYHKIFYLHECNFFISSRQWQMLLHKAKYFQKKKKIFEALKPGDYSCNTKSFKPKQIRERWEWAVQVYLFSYLFNVTVALVARGRFQCTSHF